MLSLLCCATALVTWPAAPATRRLRDLTGERTRHRLRPPRPSSVTLATAAVLVGWLIAGVGGALAALLAAATARRRWRARGELHRALDAVDGLAEAIHSLVAGLRAGAHPADAAESAAEDARPEAAASMRAIAAAARLDGDVRLALGGGLQTTLGGDPQTTVGGGPQTLATGLARVSRAWTLAQRHGLPLADILAAVGRDLEQRVRFARQVLARMAGPRTSATVLALLPALGIVLGEAIGARPLRMLTGPGQLLLALRRGPSVRRCRLVWPAHWSGGAAMTSTVNPASPFLLAVAILLWSRGNRPRARLRRLGSRRPRWRPGPRTHRATLAVSAGVLVTAVVGLPLGLLIGSAAAAATWWLARRLTGSKRPATPDPLGLAATWDLLAACLRAGLPVPTAITAIAGDLPPDASRALRATADLLAMGSDPVDAWAPAMACPHTAALARGARHTARSGTTLADVVATLAVTVRDSAGDAAEARAQRAGVLIAAPLGVCFLPAFICLGIAPVVAGLAGQLSI